MTKIFEEMSLRLGMRDHEILKIATTAPVRYKVYYIPKRSGGRREIAQPAPEVKKLQRLLIEIFLNKLPIHPAATAYRTGLSIRDNATPHAHNGPILKLDFKDFFPSLRAKDWAVYCERTGCLDKPDIDLTSRLLFRRVVHRYDLRLAIGAPSSPILSNILMYQFDELVASAVATEKVVYTRYADDMTFSAPRTGYLNGVVSKVARIIRQMDSPNLDLNREKTTCVTKRYHRTVTGLTLANDGRVTLGREKKRVIRAAVYRATQDALGPAELQMLAGMLAYANAVEPAYLDVLRKKYGDGQIVRIQKAQRGSRLHPHTAPLGQK